MFDIEQNRESIGTWQMDYAGFGGDIVRLRKPFIATIETEDGYWYLTNSELNIHGADHSLSDAQDDISKVLHQHLDKYTDLKIDRDNTYTSLLRSKRIGDFLLGQSRCISDRPQSKPLKRKNNPRNKYAKIKDENGKSVMRYRMVVKDVIGRPIPKGMSVHHINGKHQDDRPCNLYLCTWDEHRRFHHKKKLPQMESNLKEFIQ